MDLESESSALESVEENEVITPERLGKVGETIIENGSCGGEHESVDDQLLADAKEKGVEVSESVNSPPLTVKSPGGSVGSSPPGTAKGYGLKKWRRIKREFNKDGHSNVDTSKILKRGLSSSMAKSTKSQNLTVEIKQRSEGSVSSTNGMVKSPGIALDGFVMHGSNLDSKLAVGPTFAAGTDSENSEDRSSKSSTAASAPKLRYENPAVVGYAREKNRMKNLSGKNLGNVVQRQGKGRIETSKKPRGERVKIEKENSHSSMESDSRSSNFVFMQGTNSVTSNGRQSGRSMNYDGENSDEAQGGEQQFSKEIRTGYVKENEGEFEDLSPEDLAADLSWEVKEEKSDNHRTSTDRDPLVESILTLQSTQEELEKEVQKLREIGKEHISQFYDSTQGSSLPSEFFSVDPNIPEASSSDQLHSGEIRHISSDSLETQAISLKWKVNLLESKLEEARATLKVKEVKVIELEASLESNKSSKEEMRSMIELQQKNHREMEAELEGLFKQKIEAEIEYLAISRTIQMLRVAEVDQITILEEQKSLALEQAQMLNKLGDAESKAVLLKRQAEKLGTYCGDLVENNEVLKLQKRVCKLTWCFFIQLILLVVVFVLFVLQLSPHYAGVLPT
uniref:Putative WPP domain interacting protein 1 n=1 Tax=Davidia involucrata TaxID=16924 RepID=A0A5B7B0M5_DAVIN